MYLERPPHPEDTVVGLLWRQSLERELHGFALFGDEIIGPGGIALSVHVPFLASCNNSKDARASWASIPHAPQSQLAVAGGIEVPARERLHPAREPWSLGDVGGESRVRHGGSRR